MAAISESFNINFICLRFFGVIWPGKISSIYYKFFSGFYIFTTLIVYYIILILNLLYTPRNIELLIREILFFFAETLSVSKALMIFLKQKPLVRAFNILDCEHFKGEGDISRKIVSQYIAKYKTYWKFIAILSHMAYLVKMSVHIGNFFYGYVELPFYNYYFLQEETIDRYFVFLWLYQAYGIYGHMLYNMNVNTLIAGLFLIVVAQVEMLDYELRSLKCDNSSEQVQVIKLNKCLRHYEILLQYSNEVQDITSVTMFVQFTVASGSICAILCSLLLPKTFGELISLLAFMSSYAFVVTLEIFTPSYLGTQLRYKSQKLVNAAYSSEWIARSESFKRSLKIFMLRANTPIVFSGCGLFPLTLDTFTSIMKSAYSFFTIVRNFQNHDKKSWQHSM